MSDIAIIGAGLGGVLAAYELRDQVRPEDRVLLIAQGETFQFTPSNPWVALGWRKPEDISAWLTPVMSRRGVELIPSGASRVFPDENQVLTGDGRRIRYDYLVIASGPDLAFDEIEGLGPEGFTHSICRTAHAELAYDAFEALCRDPGPVIVGAVQGASCFGPAYEFAMMLDTELRKRRVRDRAPMSFVTSEPYIGHLGLDGVGDTKGLLESEMRQRHIKWVCNARVKRIEKGLMHIEEISEDGSVRASRQAQFSYAMMLPAFRGVPAVSGIDGLVNQRGFVLIDAFQRNPRFQNVFAVGVCVAIPPMGPTPVPVGVPKTGFMIESMVSATARNIGALVHSRLPVSEATWNAVCLADFGDGGVAFIAQPQIPPRNVNWSAQGRWVHLAKAGFERYFLSKVRRGVSEPFYERLVLDTLGVHKIRQERTKG